MSDGPRYEITGDISRFDERDTVFSREALVPGSVEEIEYHRRNPGLAEVDSILSKFILSKMEGGEDVDSLARAVYDSQFMPPAALALPDMVDGNPESTKIEWEPEDAAARIKRFCRLLGAAAGGLVLAAAPRRAATYPDRRRAQHRAVGAAGAGA